MKDVFMYFVHVHYLSVFPMKIKESVFEMIVV